MTGFLILLLAISVTMSDIIVKIGLLVIMIISWIVEFILGKKYYESYTGDTNDQVCSICLEDFDKNSPPVFLSICFSQDHPKHFFHEECIERHSEYSDHCPMCRKVFKSDRYFRLGNINRNRYDLNRFNSGIQRFEHL